MKLLAISGGPDSMALLNDYKKAKIVVAHINYKKRNDSNKDQEIVRNFCKKYNIPFELKIPLTAHKGNFQNWARNFRYKFFQEIYKKYNCNKLIMAHHKDDFLETAIMQQRSRRNPEYFGIRKRNKIDNMNIYRPYIFSYWKNDLLQIVNKSKIPYAIDSSNKSNVYERNRIRKELSQKTVAEKQSMLRWYKSCNHILKKKHKKITRLFRSWEKKQFSILYFNLSIYKEELMFKFIHKNNLKINLSAKKLKEIVKFTLANNQAHIYKLNSKYILKKKDKKIIILKI